MYCIGFAVWSWQHETAGAQDSQVVYLDVTFIFTYLFGKIEQIREYASTLYVGIPLYASVDFGDNKVPVCVCLIPEGPTLL